MFLMKRVIMLKKVWRQKILSILFGIGIVLVMALTIGFRANAKLPAKVNKRLQKLLQAAPDFSARFFRDEDGRILHYRMLEPLKTDDCYVGANYEGKTASVVHSKYPLVIFLGGTHERGANNIKQLKYAGPFFNNRENRRKYPCFVVIPQCPTGQNWVHKESYFGTVPLAPEATEPLQLTVKLILSLERRLNIDTKRLYVMGISSGASGVWDLTARYPEMFAAATPFAGCGDVNQASRLIRTPIWIFHGAVDLVVNPKCSRLMYHAILKAGGNPRYTEYPMTGHVCWVRAFKEPELLCWLFAQRR
jgi:predicted peptidase